MSATAVRVCPRCDHDVEALAPGQVCDECAAGLNSPDGWVWSSQVSGQYVDKITAAKCEHDLAEILGDCLASLVGRIRGQMEDLLGGPITEDARASLQSLLDDANAISHTHFGNADELAYCISIGEHPGVEPEPVAS